MAGVSVSTVSRSLNDSSLVAESTKRRIQKIADELGFEFNASARGLITSQVGSVGIILPEDYYKFEVNLYHSQLMNHMRMMLEKEDVDLLVSFPHNNYSGQNNIMKLVSRKKVDGLILLLPGLDKETLDYLDSRDFPYVFSHYPPNNDRLNVDVVYTDHYKGGYMAGEYLVDRGSRNLICLGATVRSKEYQIRIQGFKAALADKGISFDEERQLVLCDTTFEGAYDVVRRNSAAFSEADGCFALNDLMAFGLIRRLEEMEHRIPGDIRIVGYDNVEFSRLYKPSLTTISQPAEDIARLTMQRLFHKIEDRRDGRKSEKKRIIIDPTLVIRESA